MIFFNGTFVLRSLNLEEPFAFLAHVFFFSNLRPGWLTLRELFSQVVVGNADYWMQIMRNF